MYQIRKKCADFCRLKKKAQFSRPEIFDFRKKNSNRILEQSHFSGKY